MASASHSPKESTLFVFYDLIKEAHWTYARLPKGWRWVGAGFTVPVGTALSSAKYPREEQFMGPMASKEAMRHYLERQFSNIKKKQWVSRYKIRASYVP